MSHAEPPVELSPELWLVKLLLGGIDSAYDTKDEKSRGRHPSTTVGSPPIGPPAVYVAPSSQYGCGGLAQQGLYMPSSRGELSQSFAGPAPSRY